MGAFTSESVRCHAPACWLPLSHADAIRQHPRTRLAALCDVDPDAVRRAGAAHGVEALYTNPRLLLDEVRPRLAAIATRTMGRAVLIADALAAGARALHVEKPLCNGVHELRELRTVLSADTVYVTYGAVRRHFPIYRRARELADSGDYGALREIRVALGRGQLFWTHPHAVDLILFAAGARRMAGVQARLADVRSRASRFAVESDPLVVGATLHFDDGVAGHITQALGADLVLSCADAEIAVRADGLALDVYAARAGSPYPSLEPLAGPSGDAGPCGTLAPIAHLAACLDEDPAAIAANRIVKRDVLRGQQVLFAMLQSHLEGSRIVEPEAADEAIFIEAITGGRHA